MTTDPTPVSYPNRAPSLFDAADVPVGAHGLYGPTADGRYVTPYEGQPSVLSIETVDAEAGLILVRSDHVGAVRYAIFRRGAGLHGWKQATRELTEAEVPRFSLRVRPDQEAGYSPGWSTRPICRWLESAWLAAGADQ